MDTLEAVTRFFRRVFSREHKESKKIESFEKLEGAEGVIQVKPGTPAWEKMSYEKRWESLSDYEKEHYPNPPTGRYLQKIEEGIEVFEEEGVCLVCGGEFLLTHTVVDDDVWGYKGKSHKECQDNALVAADLLGI